MKTLHRLASDISTESLFMSGGTLHTEQIKAIFSKSWKYDNGKYSNEIKKNDLKEDIPIWYVSKSDKYGKYLQLRCVDTNILSTLEIATYNRIKEIWTGKKL